ncbi:hypothetical protein BN874_2900013 [Candidatus Contendobacter odensis Run_B_J11]|uniref:Uncharacterized protein n=1 Tax=Candidatus Contendobacter odensis Run_B_J11 TaxID=1400861 RepID=A0A7U7GCD2_9GAMM|nr:hypothetical protein BN874_2900013 [Candidatus Contendobacter odensis Run_B_J11]
MDAPFNRRSGLKAEAFFRRHSPMTVLFRWGTSYPRRRAGCVLRILETPVPQNTLSLYAGRPLWSRRLSSCARFATQEACVSIA